MGLRASERDRGVPTSGFTSRNERQRPKKMTLSVLSLIKRSLTRACAYAFRARSCRIRSFVCSSMSHPGCCQTSSWRTPPACIRFVTCNGGPQLSAVELTSPSRLSFLQVSGCGVAQHYLVPWTFVCCFNLLPQSAYRFLSRFWCSFFVPLQLLASKPSKV